MKQSVFLKVATVGLISIITSNQSNAEQIEDFSSGTNLSTDWISWTNDDSQSDGWGIESDMLTQSVPNYDDEYWGDRFLILPDGLPSLSNVGDSVEVSVDLNYLDYAGKIGSWVGVALFVDPDDPTNSDRVCVILERAEGVGYSGLRIHASNGMSKLHSIPVQTLDWYRLNLKCQRIEDGIRILAKIGAPDNLPEDWQLDHFTSSYSQENSNVFALGTSAEYGFTINPRIAFDNLSISSLNGTATLLESPSYEDAIAIRSAEIDEFLENKPVTRDFSEATNRRLEEINSTLENIANKLEADTPVPVINQYRDVSKRRGRLSNHRGIEWFSTKSNKSMNEIVDRKDDAWVRGLTSFSDKDFVGAALEFKELALDADENVVDWEAARLLVHSLEPQESRRDDYWRISSNVLNQASDDDIIQDIMYNQMKALEGERRFAESRELGERFFEEYPLTDYLADIFLNRLNTYFMQGKYDRIISESESILDTYGAESREGLVGLLYLGIALAVRGESGDLIEAFDVLTIVVDSNQSSVKVGVEEGHLPTIALFWKLWIADRLGDKQSVEVLKEQMSTMPDSDRKFKALRRYTNRTNGDQQNDN